MKKSSNNNDKTNVDIFGLHKENVENNEVLSFVGDTKLSAKDEIQLNDFLSFVRDDDDYSSASTFKTMTPDDFRYIIPKLSTLFTQQNILKNHNTILDLLSHLDEESNFLFINNIDQTPGSLIAFIMDIIVDDIQSIHSQQFLNTLSKALSKNVISTSKKHLIKSILENHLIISDEDIPHNNIIGFDDNDELDDSSLNEKTNRVNSNDKKVERHISFEKIKQLKNICPGVLDGYLLYSIILVLAFDEHQHNVSFFKNHSHEFMTIDEKKTIELNIQQSINPFFDLFNFIKTYKTRRDLPDCIEQQFDKYLSSIHYESNLLKQEKNTLAMHNKNVKYATVFLNQLVKKNLLLEYFQHIQYDFWDLHNKQEVADWYYYGENFLDGIVWIKHDELLTAYDNAINDNDNYKNFLYKLDDPQILSKPSLDFSKEDFFEHLSEKFPNFIEVIQFFKSQFRLNRITNKNRIQPVLLLGEPGIGKTHFAKTLAKILKTGYTFIDLASATDAWVLSGLHASWKNGKPGKLFQAMFYSSTANPVILLDEIEKAPKGHHDSTTPLYQLLEETNAKEFVDEFVDFPVDLSHMIVIACANDLEPLSEPLQSRFRIFNIPNPTKDEQKIIVQSIYEDEIVNSSAFEKKLDNIILEQLVDFSIRECKVRIAEAVGQSLLSLSSSELDNIDNSNVKIKITEQHINFKKNKKKVFGFNDQ